MTPLYDVLSAWPVIGDGPNQVSWQRARLSMAVQARLPKDFPAALAQRIFDGVRGQAGAFGRGASV